MAVDRGGLQYTIEIRDKFSATSRQFRKDMSANKRAFSSFQKGLSANRDSIKALRDTAVASRKAGVATRQQDAHVKEFITTNKRLAKELDQVAKAQRAREQIAVRLRNSQARDAKRRQAEIDREIRDQQRALRAQVAADNAKRKASERQAKAQRTEQQRAERLRAKEAADIQRQSALRLQEVSKQQAAMERLAAAQIRAARATQQQNAKDQTRLTDSLPRVQAQKALNRELHREEVVRQRIRLLRARAATEFSRGDLIGGRRTLRSAKELEKSMDRTAKSASGMLFTFRRLVGTLAVFTLAREAVASFNSLVASGVQFNDTIASSTIGVAGLVSTLTDVRDATGQSVSKAEELVLAMGLAREQVRLLRQDSLRTTATFEQLLDTFQVAVAPGFTAGLDLDEIRQLTVQISQAASAIGLPQNQLAEEIRSLLSGTIQARTTRIATSLGITNADIRRLKESGELFDFLNEKFEGFALSAERQARTTLQGIRTLVQGATAELLGQSAQPLFDELLSLGNQLFDEVLTIRDEAGNILPNPKAVAAFTALFDALSLGVQRARELGQELGFDGLQDILEAAGTALVVAFEFALGAGKALFAIFTEISDVITSIGEALGVSNNELGALAGRAGAALVAFAALRQVLKLVGVDFKLIQSLTKKMGPALRALATGPAALFAASIGIVLTGFNLLLDSIFKVNVSFGDTIELIGVGMLGALTDVLTLASELGARIATGMTNGFDEALANARSNALESRAFFNDLFGDSEESVALNQKAEHVRLESENRIAARKKQLAVEIADIEAQGAAKSKAIQEEIAKIVGARAGKSAQGAGFDPTVDPSGFGAAANQAGEAAAGLGLNISTADKPIAALAEGLVELNDELLKADVLFRQAQRTTSSGLSSQLSGEFDKEELKNAERLREVRNALLQTQRDIRSVRSGESADEGRLVSLLRDEADLRDAIALVQGESNRLAATRAATIAAKELPALRETNVILTAQLAQERAIEFANASKLNERQKNILAARTAVQLAQKEFAIQKAANTEALAAAQSAVTRAPEGAEKQALEQNLTALERKLELEEMIAQIKLNGLKTTQNEAVLIEDGSFFQGVAEGFDQLAADLPSSFQLGLELSKQLVTDFSAFVGSSIVQAIIDGQDEGVDSSEAFEQAAGQFAKQLATQLLTQVIQTFITKLLSEITGAVAVEVTTAQTAASIKISAAETAAAAEIAAARTAAGIRAGTSVVGATGPVPGGGHTGGLVVPEGFNSGGAVPHFGGRSTPLHTAFGIGLRNGGRPPGLHPLDTVPAFLQPGEFVIRKSVVDSLGLGFFESVNNGAAGVPAAASTVASGVAGFQGGGTVQEIGSSGGDDSEGMVLPVLVAGESQYDKMIRGGARSNFRFMRENSGTLGPALDRNNNSR